jgi:DNA-directed RNA polymerase subunit F
MTQQLNKDFLQKVVGFAEATNQMMKKAEDQRSVIRKEAEAAYETLKEAGKVDGDDKDAVIEGFVAHPEMALKLAAAAVKEAGNVEVEVEAEVSTAKKKAEESEGEDQGLAIGGADEEGKEAHVRPASRESDEVWEKGFGFGN